MKTQENSKQAEMFQRLWFRAIYLKYYSPNLERIVDVKDVYFKGSKQDMLLHKNHQQKQPCTSPKIAKLMDGPDRAKRKSCSPTWCQPMSRSSPSMEKELKNDQSSINKVSVSTVTNHKLKLEIKELQEQSTLSKNKNTTMMSSFSKTNESFFTQGDQKESIT